MSTCYLVRIVYETPEAVVYKNISAAEYPKFLESYPDKALSKGLKVSKINIEKEFQED